MTDSIRVGVQLWTGSYAHYRTWREAVIDATADAGDSARDRKVLGPLRFRS